MYIPAAMALRAACLNWWTMAGISWVSRARGCENGSMPPPGILAWNGSGMGTLVDDTGAWPLGWRSAISMPTSEFIVSLPSLISLKRSVCFFS